ncbi:carbohydrate porin [Pleurocapsales cyanobacterium LEGE 10410]|nr:carbohydrate porin [Pleurocapsales cyanobacterium LEGE 10410]
MFNRVINLLPGGAIACGVFFLTCDRQAWAMPNRAVADPLYNYQDGFGQVINVNQLRDVAPTDWAYEALRSLVERYGCIAGYPNQTYRGSQPLTRYEFAAGLNSCLNQIERLIASNQSVAGEDLAMMQRLATEFEAELATLGGRVDELETRTAVLEDNAFSTTTKLNAEIVSYILGVFGDEKPDGTEVDDEITVSSRIRLNFDSSFTGQDRLRVRLQARNITSPAESGGTNSLALNFEGDNNNSFEIDDLHYSFPITEKIFGFAGTNGVDVDDVFDVVPTMGIAYDTLSLFSAYNNLIYDNGNGGGAALGLNIEVVDWANLDVGYFATNPADSDPGNGLFNGNYAAGANLNISLLEERLNIALAYLRAYQGAGSGYDLAGFVGTDAATDPFGDRANSTNNYGFATGFQVLEQLAIGGYFGYTTASTIDDEADADILNWSAYLTYSDLLKEGSALVVSFGQPPSLSDSEGNALAEEPNNPYLLNLEYQYSLNDNIQFTPGGYALFNPNGDSDNDTIYVGTLRTIFRF